MKTDRQVLEERHAFYIQRIEEWQSQVDSLTSQIEDLTDRANDLAEKLRYHKED